MLKKLYSSSREPLKKYRDYNKTTGNSIIHIHFMIKHAYICIHEPCLRFSCNLLLLHVLPSFLSRDLQTFGVCCKQRFMSLSFCHLRGVIFLASSFTHHSLVGWLVGCLDACLAGTATGWLRHSLGNWQVHTDRRSHRQTERATEGPQKIHGLFITFPHCRRCSYGTELVFSSVDLWHYAQIHIEWVVYTMQHKNRRTGPRNKTEAGWPDI